MFQTSLLITLAALFGYANSFTGHGHILTTRMAYDILSTSNPSVLAQANAILATLEQSNPSLTHKEAKYPFVECVTLPDDIKYNGGGWQSDWHFVDIPWFDQGGTLEDFPDYHPNSKNLTGCLPGLVSFLKGEEGYQDHWVYQTIKKYYPNEGDALSMALRLIIHLFGDLHQPLHCESKINPTYPEGDAGGNAIEMKYHYDVDNLHSLWDTGIYEYHDSITLPFDDAHWLDVGNEVSILHSTYTFSTAEIHNLDFDAISYDSYNIAISTCYTGININETASQEYIDKNIGIDERQIALGGQRLAYLMETIFDTTAESFYYIDEEEKAMPSLFLQ